MGALLGIGFTIINLLIVVVNVGLLFAINKQYTEVLKIRHIQRIGKE